MTRIVTIPGEGNFNTELEVPDNYAPGSPEEQRLINEFKASREQSQQSDTPQASPYEAHDVDPSKADSWGTWADKSIRSGLRGSVLGLTGMADVARNAAVNDYRYFTNPGGGDYVEGSPISDWTQQNVLAPLPQGTGYEDTQELGAIAGPAIVESMITEGLGARRFMQPGVPITRFSGHARPGMDVPVSVLNNPITRTVARATRDTGLGVGGGAVGGEVAANMFGEQNRDLGRLLGGALVSAGAPTLVRTGLSKSLMTPESLGNLRKIDRVNETLPEGERIPLTTGLIGSKAASNLEDVTGRTIFSQNAANARRQQFRGMESGVVRNVEAMRGGPASGDISPASIGSEAKVAVASAKGKAQNRIQQIQDDLEAQVGSTSPVNFQNTVNELDDIIKRPKEYDAGTIQQAQDLRATILKNLQRPKGAGSRRGRVSVGTAGYGATKDVRSKLGRIADRNQKPLEKAVQDRAYGGLTDDMTEAAAMQGVDPVEFAAKQAETTGLYKDVGGLEKLAGETASDTNVFQNTVGERNAPSSQLEPLMKHSPDETLKLLADDLELRLRGGSAGKQINPDLFRPEVFDRWRSLPADRKALLARNNPDVIRRMDDLADVGTMELSRGGKRTRPGVSGSTIGATANYAWPAVLAALTKKAGVGIATLGLPKAASMFLTSPGVTRVLADPQVGLGTVLARAIGGGAAGVGSGYYGDAAAQRAERERKAREAAGVPN